MVALPPKEDERRNKNGYRNKKHAITKKQ